MNHSSLRPTVLAFGVVVLGGMLCQTASADLIANFSQLGPNPTPVHVSHDAVSNITTLTNTAPIPITITAGTLAGYSSTNFMTFSNVISQTAPLTTTNRQYGFSGVITIEDSGYNPILTATFTNAYLTITATGGSFVAVTQFVPVYQTLSLNSVFGVYGSFQVFSLAFSSGTNPNSGLRPNRSFETNLAVAGTTSAQNIPLPPLSIAPEPSTLITGCLASLLSLAYFVRSRRSVA